MEIRDELMTMLRRLLLVKVEFLSIQPRIKTSVSKLIDARF